jgi:hypothetical protein
VSQARLFYWKVATFRAAVTLEAARRATLSGRHTSGPGQATSATRRHGRIGHEQNFVAKTRLRTLCTQAALRIKAGPSNPPAKVCLRAGRAKVHQAGKEKAATGAW